MSRVWFKQEGSFVFLLSQGSLILSIESPTHKSKDTQLEDSKYNQLSPNLMRASDRWSPINANRHPTLTISGLKPNSLIYF